jgi:chromate transporter
LAFVFKLVVRAGAVCNLGMSVATTHPTFAEAFRFWLKLGFISFGGPTGQIAIMHRELVERRKWISEERFVHALNYCMLLPGPEAQQLATYSGWLLHGTPGGLVAGILFVLPSAIILWALSWVYVTHGHQEWVIGVLAGLKPAVVAIVASAVIRIGSRVLKNPIMWCLASAALIGIAVFHLPFPVIIFSAALIGFIGERMFPTRFAVLKAHGEALQREPASDHAGRPSRTWLVAVFCLIAWWLPVLFLMSRFGNQHAFSQQGLFFSKAAMVTVGGAYAVLPYVAQQAVEHFGWVTRGEMVDGLGFAETTPGPLIMVLQFVGFLGGWKNAPPLSPLAGGTLGAFITTWTTFAPSFFYIFAGAPYIERMRTRTELTAALSAVTAAVVGVILNLALWFGRETLVPPGAINLFGIVICAGAFAALQWGKRDIIPVVGAAAVLGLLGRAVGWVGN